MNHTAFPSTPEDVAALTVQEFTFDLDQLDGNGVPSLERVCRTFMDDANRALVWWIRFGAFRSWCARTDVMTRSTSDSWIVRDACEVAASFPPTRAERTRRFNDAAGPPSGLHRLVFARPLPLDQHELRRLTPAAAFSRSLIGATPADWTPREPLDPALRSLSA